MMVADEIRALLLIHDRLKAWEQPFVRDMAKLLEQRGFLTTKQLATVKGIMDRHRISSVPAQAVPGQLIPTPVDQNPWAQSRSPSDMMRQG